MIRAYLRMSVFDEATGGTPSVDWEADDVPANPEPPTGVIVDEHDAKVIANHTFLSNVKRSSIFNALGNWFYEKHFW